MAEVVKVPVLGSVKKPWLYAGGAAVAGIVGYAWWTQGSQADEEGFAVELPATEFTPPTVVDSGISVGNATPTPGIAENNLEWANLAREQAAAFGYSAAATATALVKYLGKAPLTPTEAALIRAVVNVLGPPPQNGPHPITESIPEPPPPHQDPPPVQQPPPSSQPPPASQPPPSGGGPPTTFGGVAVAPEGGDRYAVAFNETPGATAYRLRWETSNSSSGWVSAWPGAMGYAGTYTWRFGQPNVQFAVRVQAGNASGFDPHGIVSGPVWST